eukprot:403372797
MTDQFMSSLNTQSILAPNNQYQQQQIFIPHIITSSNPIQLKKNLISPSNISTKNAHNKLLLSNMTTNNASVNDKSQQNLTSQYQLQQIHQDVQNPNVQQYQHKSTALKSRDSSPINSQQPESSVSISNLNLISIENSTKSPIQQQQQHAQHFNHVNSNNNQQQSNVVNTNQIYLNSKQAEQAAILGAQIILNQYIKIQQKAGTSNKSNLKERGATLDINQDQTNNSKNSQSFNTNKQKKRDKMLPKKKALEKAREQIISQNSQFLPHIQQAKLISNQKTHSQQQNQNHTINQQPTQLGTQQVPIVIGSFKGIPTVRNTNQMTIIQSNHQKKKSLSQNDTESVLKNVNRNTHKNLMTFIEEQKRYAQDMIVNIQSKTSNIPLIGQHRDVRHAKSFVNKLEMKDRVNGGVKFHRGFNNVAAGNFFQIKSSDQALNQSFIQQQMMFENEQQDSENQIVKSNYDQQNLVMSANGFSLPKINQPYVDRSKGEIISARHSVLSYETDAQYFNHNLSLNNKPTLQLNDQDQLISYQNHLMSIFPDQSTSSKQINSSSNINPNLLKSIDALPFTNNRKRLSNNPSELGGDINNNLIMSSLGNDRNHANRKSQSQLATIAQNHMLSPKNNNQNQNESSGMNKNQTSSVIVQSTKNDYQKYSEAKQLQNFQNQIKSEEQQQLSNRKQNNPISNYQKFEQSRNSTTSLISGFLKQKLKFKSPREDDSKLGQVTMLDSIMIQSMALSTQQSCQNILKKTTQKSLIQCVCNCNTDSNSFINDGDASTPDINDQDQNSIKAYLAPLSSRNNDNTIEITNTQNKHLLTSRYQQQSNNICRFCSQQKISLKYQKNRTPLGTYSIDFNSKKQQRLKMLLNKKVSNISISQIGECKDFIKQLFQQTKKLPASTTQKLNQTMRIGFSRRQNMENKPLIILIFNDLVGLMESQFDQVDKKLINYKMFFGKIIVLQGIKHERVNELSQQNEAYNARQETVNVMRQSQYQITTSFPLSPKLSIQNIFIGQSPYNLETLNQHLLQINDVTSYKNVRVISDLNLTLNENCLDLPQYFKNHNDLIDVLDYQIQQKLDTLQPDLKISGLLSGLKAQNLNIATEMRKYVNYYKSKYKLIQENPNIQQKAVEDLGFVYSALSSNGINTANYQSVSIDDGDNIFQQQQFSSTKVNNLEQNNIQDQTRTTFIPRFDEYNLSFDKQHISNSNKQQQKILVNDDEDCYENGNIKEPTEQQNQEQKRKDIDPKIIIIGYRNNNIIDDYVLVEQKSVKSTCINVLDWLSKR